MKPSPFKALDRDLAKPAKITIIQSHTDDLNIETIMFHVEGEYRVRVRDLDAGENVSLTKCVDAQQAFDKYAAAIAGSDDAAAEYDPMNAEPNYYDY